MIRKIDLSECVVTVTPMEEDISPDDPSLPYGAETIADFQDMIDRHGLWGWCCVKVEVKWGPLVGTAYLGCCSYESEEDFRKPGGYFDDMVEEALSDVRLQALDVVNRLEGTNV